MSNDLYLIAHVLNAQSTETAYVELEIATTDSGDWFNNDGYQLWPFWTQRLEIDLPAIPDGWLDHLQEQAIHYASAHKEPKVSLLDRLNLHHTQPPIIRRI